MARPAGTLRRRLKGWLKKRRRDYYRWFFGFDAPAFQTALTDLGVRRGDVLMVHAAFDRFEGYTGAPLEIITALESAVGAEGTLLMPTLPFSGTALAWAESGAVFDVAKTPSRMGLLSELLRRLPGTVRSLHPTHAVAARGALAQRLCADHARADTPCGQPSPYARLLDHGGRILFLGVTIEAMTFFHTAEALLEPRMPFSPFTAERFTLVSRDATGATVTSATRLFDPHHSRRRRIALLTPALQARGHWRQRRLGRLEMTLLEAAEVLAALEAMAARGEFCYGA